MVQERSLAASPPPAREGGEAAAVQERIAPCRPTVLLCRRGRVTPFDGTRALFGPNVTAVRYAAVLPSE